MTRAAFGVERAVRRQRLGQCFAAVIDAAHEHQFLFAANQDRALQVSHVQEQKRVLGKNLWVGEFERVEGTDGRKLKNVRRRPVLGCTPRRSV